MARKKSSNNAEEGAVRSGGRGPETGVGSGQDASAASRIRTPDVTGREGAEAEREQLLERLRQANQELLAAGLREQESAEEARRRAEEAERAVRSRDEFLSLAAHELKTPLTSLRGFSQAILRKHDKTGAIDRAEVVHALRHIDRQTKRLADLAHQLLDVSRLEAGKLVVDREETPISSMVNDALASIREVYPKRVFQVRDAGSAKAWIDPSRMEQVITNLVENAVKFSPANTPVEIDVVTDGQDQIVISVRDHGRGIPEDDRSKVFRRFYQAHPQQHYGGMGLGLYISSQIVEMHGGTIACEAPEGGGSRFVVRLPVEPLAKD